MNIGYAFPGFLYLPLFLAEADGLFPASTVVLDCAFGDEQAVKQMYVDQDNLRADVVLCDPLVLGNDFVRGKKREVGISEAPIVFGSFIEKAPVWLVNPGPVIKPVLEESALRAKVKKIRCYESPNTGYVIGRRLQSICTDGNKGPDINAVKFGEEFKTPIEDSEVLVTSDVLQMAKFGFSNECIIFSYPSADTDIQKMFFTGIVTRSSFLQKNLSDALGVLRGLGEAIKIITGTDLEALTNKILSLPASRLDLEKEFPGETEAAVRQYVKDAIHQVLNGEHIYSTHLQVIRSSWTKSAKLRKKYVKGWKSLGYDAVVNPVPSTLLSPDWPTTLWLRALRLRMRRLHERVSELRARAQPAAALLASILGLVLWFALLTRNRGLPQEDSVTYSILIGIGLMICVMIVLSLIWLVRFRSDDDETTKYWRVKWAWALGVTLTVVAIYNTFMRTPPVVGQGEVREAEVAGPPSVPLEGEPLKVDGDSSTDSSSSPSEGSASPEAVGNDQ